MTRGSRRSLKKPSIWSGIHQTVFLFGIASLCRIAVAEGSDAKSVNAPTEPEPTDVDKPAKPGATAKSDTAAKPNATTKPDAAAKPNAAVTPRSAESPKPADSAESAGPAHSGGEAAEVTKTESSNPQSEPQAADIENAIRDNIDADIESTGTYKVRLSDLEQRVNRLKEQIFRSKARLNLLAETVLNRKIAGSKAAISFRNEMGGSFRLVKATFLMDGAPIFNKSDEAGSLSDQEILSLFDGPVMPGEHTLSVVLLYRGHGYGIFSYLSGYQFTTKSSRTFTINEGRQIKLEVVGFEKGDATTPLEDRPDIRYIVTVVDDETKALQKDVKSKGAKSKRLKKTKK